MLKTVKLIEITETIEIFQIIKIVDIAENVMGKSKLLDGWMYSSTIDC